MNTKMKMRLLSILLCFVMLVGLLPITAFAVQQPISAVVATAENLEPTLYGLMRIPEFTYTEGSPAYLNASSSNLQWQKNIEGIWTNQNGRFTPGEWRIWTSLRIDGTENCLNYKLDENGVTLKVNGQDWTVETHTIGNYGNYSFASVYSPVFTVVDDPNVQPPVAVESVHMRLHGYEPGAAATAATITTDANVTVSVLGFLKFIDIDSDGVPETPIEFTGNFASGEGYAVGLKIEAKPGYDISGLTDQDVSLDRAIIGMADFDPDSETISGMYLLGDVIQHTVSFETNGGSAIQPVSVGTGTTVAEPAEPTKAYYAFAGWYSDEALTTPFDFANTAITADTTLYAKWTPSPVGGMFLMTIDFNGGTSSMPSSGEVPANTEIHFVEDFGEFVTPPAGKVLVGYEIDGVPYNFGDAYLATENFTLKLLWEDASVTVNMKTGDKITDYTNAQQIGMEVLLFKGLLVEDAGIKGYRNTQGKLLFTIDIETQLLTVADGVTAQDTVAYELTPQEQSDVLAQFGVKITKITLNFVPNPVTSYTVTFDSNGGSAVTAQTVEAGQKAAKPDNPTKAGYDFKGWTLSGTAYDFNTAVNGNITLVATWQQKQVAPTTYTVTFDANGGSAVTAQTVEAGQKAAKPDDPTKAGYDFKGWTLSGSAYDFNTAVNGNITLVATWQQKQVAPTTYTVSFAANGGTGTMADVTGMSGDYMLPFCEFTAPTGKKFKCWAEDSVNGTQYYAGYGCVVDSDVTFYAVWETIPAGHTCDIKPVAKDEPSCTDGGKEAYYKCEGCGKFYEDALGAKEITDLAAWGNIAKNGHTESDWKSDKDNHWKECTVAACGVIIENSKASHADANNDGKCDTCEYNVGTTTTNPDNKPSDDVQPPKTGDNSMMWIWVALLFVSGFGVMATTVIGKKKSSAK